jgi:hypothetical protein
MSLLGLSGRTNGTFSHLFGTNIEWYDYCFGPGGDARHDVELI